MSPLRVDQSRLRVLQGLAAACVLLGVVAFAANGEPAFAALVGGFGFGMLSFLGIAVLVFAYWGAKATLWTNA
jgi:hypothetical protein